MADCPYAEMEWYCCLAEGHDGPHRSVSIGEPPRCGIQDAYTSGRCSLSVGHDGSHYAVVGAGARRWESHA